MLLLLLLGTVGGLFLGLGMRCGGRRLRCALFVGGGVGYLGVMGSLES